MPPAVRLGLSAECDIQALRLGLDWLYAQHGALAAPVALGSLSQPGFLARLEKMLGDRPALTRRLIIEVDAAGLLEQNTEMRELCRLATQAGARVGLTRLSQQFGALEHLHEFPFSYLKLGGGFVAGLLHSPAASIWPPRSRRRLKRWAWPYTPRTCRTQPRNPFWRKSASTPCARWRKLRPPA